MPAEISFISTIDQDRGQTRDNRVELFQDFAAAGQTQAMRLQGDVVVQISGSATVIDAIVEHATRDPATPQANWAPADTSNFSGDLSIGMAPRVYLEPASGFWRVRIITLTGGNCKVSVIGDRT